MLTTHPSRSVWLRLKGDEDRYGACLQVITMSLDTPGGMERRKEREGRDR